MAYNNAQSDDNIAQIYDKIFKRILTLSNVAVISFINGIFNKNFPTDSKLTYNWTENIKNNLEIEKDQSTENALKLKALINDGIIKSIEDNEKAGNITHDDTIILIGLLEKLYTHLYGGIKRFKEEGVKDMIAEKLILDIDRVMYEAEQRIAKSERRAAKSEKKAAKSEEKKALEIAKNLLSMGMAIEQIKNATNLPLSKITGLQQK